MTMFKKMTLLVAVMLTALAAMAQTPPVRWRTQVRMTNRTEGTVTFRALITPGWHLYGTGIEFTGAVTPERAAVSVDDPLFGMTLTWWDANVAFTAPFRVTDAATACVKAAITFMACDGNTCRPPLTERISAPVRIPAHE